MPHGQGWTGLLNRTGYPLEMVQQWWILPGPTPGKVIESTSSKAEMRREPWRGLWLCRDPGVMPVGFAGAVQPCTWDTSWHHESAGNALHDLAKGSQNEGNKRHITHSIGDTNCAYVQTFGFSILLCSIGLE